MRTPRLVQATGLEEQVHLGQPEHITNPSTHRLQRVVRVAKWAAGILVLFFGVWLGSKVIEHRAKQQLIAKLEKQTRVVFVYEPDWLWNVSSRLPRLPIRNALRLGARDGTKKVVELYLTGPKFGDANLARLGSLMDLRALYLQIELPGGNSPPGERNSNARCRCDYLCQGRFPSLSRHQRRFEGFQRDRMIEQLQP